MLVFVVWIDRRLLVFVMDRTCSSPGPFIPAFSKSHFYNFFYSLPAWKIELVFLLGSCCYVNTRCYFYTYPAIDFFTDHFTNKKNSYPYTALVDRVCLPCFIYKL